MSTKDELLRLLQPPAERWALPGRDEIVRGYGTELPADFLWLMETYGPGTVSDYLGILPPLPASEIGTTPGVAPMSAEQFLEVDGYDDIAPAYLEPGGLLVWGLNPNNDIAFWSPVDDPDDWPVVVRRHIPESGPTWVRFDCGVVELLVRTFQGRLPCNPFSGTDLWRNEAPSFVRDVWC